MAHGPATAVLRVVVPATAVLRAAIAVAAVAAAVPAIALVAADRLLQAGLPEAAAGQVLPVVAAGGNPPGPTAFFI